MGKSALEQQLSKSKNAIVFDTKTFDQATPDITTCEHIVTSILHLLSQGIQFTEDEYRDIFFRSSKLFRSRGANLRRLVNLLIKSIPEEEAFMVTSSLTSDMNDKSDCIRANAIRTLGFILDASTAPMFERYIKTGIVEKNPHIAAAALACGVRFLKEPALFDLVKRWGSEANQAMDSSSSAGSAHGMGSVNYLSLVMLYKLRKQDRLAQHKMVTESIKNFATSKTRGSSSPSPLSEVLLVKFAAEILYNSFERGTPVDQTIFDFIINTCSHPSVTSSGTRNGVTSAKKNTAAQVEAASVLVTLAEMDSDASPGSETAYQVSLFPVLGVFNAILGDLHASRPAERFAVARLVSRLANVRPQLVSKLNPILENILTLQGEQFRPIASLALTTLLKTVRPENVDSLIKSMATAQLMTNDSPLEFKMDAIEGVKSLCLKYPNKHKPMLKFIQTPLREENPVELKALVVDTIMHLTSKIEDARGLGLSILCEYIEDCEFSSLSSRVLSFIATECPQHPQPAKFVRFIYNRVLLENSHVRAAAVDALSRIAVACPQLKPDINSLILTAAVDAEDEVRTRATAYSTAITASASSPPHFSEADLFKGEDGLSISLDALCDTLLDKISPPSSATPNTPSTCDELLDLTTLPTTTQYREKQEQQAKANAVAQQSSSSASPTPTAVGSSKPTATTTAVGRSVSQQLADLAADIQSKISSLIDSSAEIKSALQSPPLPTPPSSAAAVPTGGLFKIIHASSRLQQLAEQEADYTVTCRKFFLDRGGLIICQISVLNSLNEGVLREVSVALFDFDTTKWAVLGCSPITKIGPRETRDAYLVLQNKAVAASSASFDGLFQCGSVFKARLNFRECEDDDDEDGFADNYGLDSLKLSTSDFFRPRTLKAGEFRMQLESNSWVKVDGQTRKVSTFNNNIPGAVAFLVRSFNMAPCDESEKVPAGANGHHLYLSGFSASNQPVLVHAQIAINPQHGCLIKMNAVSPCNATATAAVEVPR